jgi:hypothetical protein
MRLPFSDSARLRREAKANHASGLSALKRWWSGKYKLPATHPLFEGQSMAALSLEMYEDLYARRDEIQREIKDAPSAKERLELMDALQKLDEALGEREAAKNDGPMITGDALFDRWEKILAEGGVPDLDEGL